MTAALAGIVADLDETLYHRHQALSSTEARLLLQPGGPARYRWAKDNPPLVDPSPKFDIGKATHALVLGVGADIVEVKAPDWRSRAAQQERQEARDAGKAPLLTSEYQAVRAMSDAVLANTTARALLEQDGRSEVSLFATIGDVDVRARFDFLPTETAGRRTTSVDLKTTFDPSKEAFEKSVATYEYAVQRAWYLDAYAAVTGDTDPEMVFVAVGKTPPYLVGVYQIPTTWAVKGHEMAARARRIYAECAAANSWPGLTEEVVALDEPVWHIYATESESDMVI